MIWGAIAALLYACIEWHVIAPRGGWLAVLRSISDGIDAALDRETFYGYTNLPAHPPAEALRVGVFRPVEYTGYLESGFTVQRTITEAGPRPGLVIFADAGDLHRMNELRKQMKDHFVRIHS